MYNRFKKLKSNPVVGLSTSASRILPLDNNRGVAIVQNLHASIVVYVGPSTVTSSGGGIRLAAGETWLYYGRSPLYAASASGTPNVGVTTISLASNDILGLSYKTAAGNDALILPKFDRRIRATIQNLGSGLAYLGDANFASGAGIKLAQYERVDLEAVGAIYAMGPDTNAQVLFTAGGSVSAGNFKVTTLGAQTANVAYNATGAQLATAINTATGLTSVSGTGSASGPWTITYINANANTPIALPTVDSSGLTGGVITPTSAATGGQGAFSLGLTLQSAH